jgi:hypothetical protein
MKRITLVAVWPWRSDGRWVLRGWTGTWDLARGCRRSVTATGSPADVVKTIAHVMRADPWL